MAHYSSLFTMGLLSDRVSPPPSPKSNIFYKFRKSSLPNRVSSKPSEISLPSQELRAPPQFTNPFADSPTVTTELRSFLSLDLAGDKPLIARRSNKFLSPLDTNVTRTSPPYTANPPPQQHMLPSSTCHPPVPTSPLSLPSARRSSRDSLRTLPSPRPAPSSALPRVPSNRTEPHPPPIVIPSPSLFPFASSSKSAKSARGSSPTSYRPPLSAPPAAPLSSSSAFFAPTSPPVSPISFPSSRSSRNLSFMSFSSTSTSVRTARRRKVERSYALACLEGRSRTPGRTRRSIRRRNFMSMTDDEDEDEAVEGIDDGGDADVEDDGDVYEPPSRPTSGSSAMLSLSLPRHSAAMSTVSRSLVDEEEDCVLPALTLSLQTRRSSPKPSRRSTLESWFPLANFIDLKDDELQGWHGVVEIVNGL
ncbi:hypothetical protein BJV78DRAFT_1156133 [Lactifluus subvellereus]|nr:hypothetical protein BJV78DRAFT_1156133 [Lactifluus subvellereus]